VTWGRAAIVLVTRQRFDRDHNLVKGYTSTSLSEFTVVPQCSGLVKLWKNLQFKKLGRSETGSRRRSLFTDCSPGSMRNRTRAVSATSKYAGGWFITSIARTVDLRMNSQTKR